MPANKRLLAACGLAGLTVLSCCWPLYAQSKEDRASAKPAAAAPPRRGQPSSSDAIAQQEQQIAEKYKHLEDVLLRMAELSAASDPRRAALLKKAVAQSKEELIGVRFDRLVELLGKEQLSRASRTRRNSIKDLRSLLELLMSENRAKSIKDERARVRDILEGLRASPGRRRKSRAAPPAAMMPHAWPASKAKSPNNRQAGPGHARERREDGGRRRGEGG